MRYDENIVFRCTSRERGWAELAAAELDVSLSEYVRTAVREQAIEVLTEAMSEDREPAGV